MKATMVEPTTAMFDDSLLYSNSASALNGMRRRRRRIRGNSTIFSTPHKLHVVHHCPRTCSLLPFVTVSTLLMLISSFSDAFPILTHHFSNVQSSTLTTSLDAIRRRQFVRKDVTQNTPYNNVDNDDDDDDDDDFNVPIPSQRSQIIQDDDDDNTNSNKNPTSLASPIISKSHFFSQKSIHDPSFSFRLESDDQIVSNSKVVTVDNDSIFLQLCRNANIDRPSKIQSMAWPILLKQQKQTHPSSSAVVIADQTGSGKTLAYLIPLIQHMLHTKLNNPKIVTASTSTAATPKLLILTPTAELADQIRNVCARLSGESNEASKSYKSLFKTVVLTATGQHATNIRDQIRLLQQYKNNVDVIISTPGRIATILRTKQSSQKIIDVQYLQAVVFDEVDVLLLDETFGPQLQTIGEATTPSSLQQQDDQQQQQPPSTKYVFVTATLPDSVLTQIKEQFTNTILVKGPGLHRVAPTVREKLIDVSVPSSVNRNIDLCFDIKANAVQQALRQNRCQRTLIFCNTVSTCRQVENLLYRIDRRQQIYNVKAYHNAMSAEARNENLAYFANAGKMKRGQQDVMTKVGYKSNDRDGMSSSSPSSTSASYILVCTDRAARGVDFHTAAVDHVILFDFPNDPAEYVRRVGRTARAGRTGASTVLAYGWQLPIARSIMGQQSLQEDDYSGSLKRRDETKKDNDNDYNDEYMGGVQGRRKSSSKRSTIGGNKKGSSSDEMIGSNIANGKLWNEKLSSTDD